MELPIVYFRSKPQECGSSPEILASETEIESNSERSKTSPGILFLKVQKALRYVLVREILKI